MPDITISTHPSSARYAEGVLYPHPSRIYNTDVGNTQSYCCIDCFTDLPVLHIRLGAAEHCKIMGIDAYRTSLYPRISCYHGIPWIFSLINIETRTGRLGPKIKFSKTSRINQPLYPFPGCKF